MPTVVIRATVKNVPKGSQACRQRKRALWRALDGKRCVAGNRRQAIKRRHPLALRMTIERQHSDRPRWR